MRSLSCKCNGSALLSVNYCPSSCYDRLPMNIGSYPPWTTGTPTNVWYRKLNRSHSTACTAINHSSKNLCTYTYTNASGRGEERPEPRPCRPPLLLRPLLLLLPNPPLPSEARITPSAYADCEAPCCCCCAEIVPVLHPESLSSCCTLLPRPSTCMKSVWSSSALATAWYCTLLPAPAPSSGL